MPNWVTNVISGEKNTIDKILKLCVKNIGDDNYIFDFNTIIPQPKTKEECESKYYADDNSHIVKEELKEWFNWYNWNLDNWGVKWNASNLSYDDNNIEFETPWEGVPELMQKLSEIIEDKFTYMYADEGITDNANIYIMNEGRIDDSADNDQFIKTCVWLYVQNIDAKAEIRNWECINL